MRGNEEARDGRAGTLWGEGMANKPQKRMGRPPKAESEAVLTKRFQVMLDPDTHAWVLDHGGAGYIRRLVEADRANTNRIPTEAEKR